MRKIFFQILYASQNVLTLTLFSKKCANSVLSIFSLGSRVLAYFFEEKEKIIEIKSPL